MYFKSSLSSHTSSIDSEKNSSSSEGLNIVETDECQDKQRPSLYKVQDKLKKSEIKRKVESPVFNICSFQSNRSTSMKEQSQYVKELKKKQSVKYQQTEKNA